MLLDGHNLCIYGKISKGTFKNLLNNSSKYSYKCYYRKTVQQLNRRQTDKMDKEKTENRESTEAGLSPNMSIITFNITVCKQKLKIQNQQLGL